jgi:hypothetical protein
MLALDIRRVENIIGINEILLDTPGRHESVQKIHASCLVIRATGAATAERLCANNCAGAFVINVEISCCQHYRDAETNQQNIEVRWSLQRQQHDPWQI